MNETNKSREANIACVWFLGDYNEAQAKLSCEMQNLDFNNVQSHYGRLREQQQKANDGCYCD